MGKENVGVNPFPLFGRRVIYADEQEITRDNIANIVSDAMTLHTQNAAEIDRLYRIFCGDMPIRSKEKVVRAEINNRITANLPNAIASFHTGYFLGKPIQYVSRGEKTEKLSDAVADLIDDLNRFADDCGKPSDDTDLAEWMFICGCGYRLALPSADPDSESPFGTHVLDPRQTFIVYSNEVGHRRMLGVTIVKRKDGTVVFNCYSDKRYFKLESPVSVVSGAAAGVWQVTEEEPHYIGYVPIVEYPTCKARLGAFELILPLADAVNMALSDLADGRQQFINALLVLKGVDIEDQQFEQLRDEGGIKVPVDGDVKYLVSELNQSQGVETVNMMIDIMLQVAHMPKRSGGSGGTSDNGIAVVLRDGYADAESYASRVERIFKKSENEFLRIVLRICSMKIAGFDLRLSSVEPHFTRQNTENLLAKVQALTTMLASPKIHPLLAWRLSTLVSDPEAAFMLSSAYEQSEIEREAQLLDVSTKPDAAARAVIA